MRVTENDNVVYFDIDETLVMWAWPKEFDGQAIKFDNFGYETMLLPHQKHIDLLKQFKVRGHHVIVHSQGGWQWAKEVVKVLGLENWVDEAKSKPKWIVDDLPATAWTTRHYIGLDGKHLSYGESKAVFGEDE